MVEMVGGKTREVNKWVKTSVNGKTVSVQVRNSLKAKKTNKYLNSQSVLSGSLLLSESSPMTQAGLCVFRLISMT